MKRLLSTCVATILPAAILLLSIQTSHAGDATWELSPGSGDWNTAANWTPATVPNSAADTATFDVSNTTGVSISASTEVDGIVFNLGASAFTITASPTFMLRISGVGITNNSAIAQTFVTAEGAGNGLLLFSNSATAGDATVTNNGATASGANGGTTIFPDSSTAGNGTFTNKGGTVSGANGGGTLFGATSNAGNGTFTNDGAAVSGANAGGINFYDTATADTGDFTNNPGAASGADGGITRFNDSTGAANGTFTSKGATVAGATSGRTFFFGSSGADNGTFTNNGGTASGANGGTTNFLEDTSADAATLIAKAGTGGGEGGSIVFTADSTGGTSRIEVFGNGNLFLNFHNPGSMTVGSIEGTGLVFLGPVNLSVGSNNLDTTFSGTISDDATPPGETITKIGTSTLALAGVGTYAGGTVVNAGTLLVNSNTSATGNGAVTVNNAGSVLGGTGTITGPVTVNTGCALLGGNGTIANGALTVDDDLTLAAGSIVELVLGASGTHSTLTRTSGTWSFDTNQTFTFINGGAQPGAYDDIITGLAADPGTGFWTISNSGFSGTFTYDAGTIDLTLTAVNPQLTGAASWKVHTGVGSLPIDFPLLAALTVECRRPNSTGDHQLIISFTDDVTVNGSPQAAVTTGQGFIGTGGVPNFGAVSVSGSDVTVPLTNVANAQTIVVTLFNVNDGTGSGDVSIPMGVLVGDTNDNGAVNSTDVTQTKSESGATVTGTNCREDLTTNGAINSSDISLVKSRSGTGIP